MTDLLLFVFAIARTLAFTGLGVGIAIALLAELCGIRVVEFGVERFSKQVSAGGQLAKAEWFDSVAEIESSRATSPPRKVRMAS